MAKKSMNMNDLPKHMTAADAELFDRELEEFGEMDVPEESLDRVLSSVMRKAGFEMKDTAMDGTSIINMYAGEDSKKETENTEITKTANVRRSRAIAACFAILFVGAGALLFFGGRGGLKTSPPKTSGSAVTAVSSEAEDRSAPSAGEEKTVIVPDVVGMTETQAAETLGEAGLVCVIHEIAVDVGEAGKVIEMSAAPGSEVDRGAEVLVFVSIGNTENGGKAKQFIDKANSLRSLRDKITIGFKDDFARFKNEFGFDADFPDVANITTVEELDRLESEYERYINMGMEEFYDNLIDLNIDRIISGEKEHAVTAVMSDHADNKQLVEETENDSVPVPDVVGLTCEEAIFKLKEAGFSYMITETYSDESDKGKVVSMSLGVSKETGKGKIITLFIGSGEAEPVMQTLLIDLPIDVEGSYTFDVYRDGSVAYTKTVGNVAALDNRIVMIDVVGKGKERLVVYVKKNVDQDNYIKYCSFDVDYDKGTVSLADGGYNTAGLYDLPMRMLE